MKDTPSKEELVTCPDCGTPNFSPRGLKAHRGNKHCRTEHAKRLDALAPEGDAVVIAPMKDAEIGAILTAQYHKACNAMPEVLRFGAMMIRLEEHLRGSKNHDGFKELPRGVNAKKGGVKGWLEKHAPEVKLSTAHRFRDVTLGIAQDYKELVGGKVAKQYSLPDLVTADPQALPEPARKKQRALFDYVAGTSQKSWLDKMRPAKERGGDTSKKAKKLTAEEQEALLAETLQSDCEDAGRKVDCLGVAYRILNDAQAEGLRDILRGKADEIEAWLKLPKSKRPLLDKVKALIGEKH